MKIQMSLPCEEVGGYVGSYMSYPEKKLASHYSHEQHNHRKKTPWKTPIPFDGPSGQ